MSLSARASRNAFSKYYSFLQDPLLFAQRHRLSKARVRKLVSVFLGDYRRNPGLIGQQPFRGKPIQSYRQFQVYRRGLRRLYFTLGQRIGPKPATVFGMEVANWRTTSFMHEEDFANQVQGLFTVISQFNGVLGGTLPKELETFLHCRLYEVVYELAGKKVLNAYYLATKKRHVTKIGIALDYFRTHNFKSLFPRFDNKFRNAVAHGTYMFKNTSSPHVEYPSIDRKGRTVRGRKSLPSIHYDTTGVLFFLMACLVVNGEQYVDLMEHSLVLVP